MKTLVFIALFVAVANAQFFPGFPFRGAPLSVDEYAASLENAPVGLYSKRHPGGWGWGGPFGGAGGSDVSGASLGGAKVGIYGKERPQQPQPVPLIRPFAVPVPPVVRPRPIITIPRPRPRY